LNLAESPVIGSLYLVYNPMKTKPTSNAHRGSEFRDFLAAEGILPEVEELALKRVVTFLIQQILEKDHVTKTELASRMKPAMPRWTACSIQKTPRSPSPLSAKPQRRSVEKWNCGFCLRESGSTSEHFPNTVYRNSLSPPNGLPIDFNVLINLSA
jgi:hypothetical protein